LIKLELKTCGKVSAKNRSSIINNARKFDSQYSKKSTLPGRARTRQSQLILGADKMVREAKVAAEREENHLSYLTHKIIAMNYPQKAVKAL